jgi:hypothetical protein
VRIRYEKNTLTLQSCKIICYQLSVFTQITYWLTRFVSIEPLSIVSVLTSLKFWKLRVSLRSSIIVIAIVSVVQINELSYHTSILDPSYTSLNITLCARDNVEPFVSIYNRINTIVHYLVPFLNQVFSIAVLLSQTAYSRQHLTAPDADERGQSEFLIIVKRTFIRCKEYGLISFIIVLRTICCSLYGRVSINQDRSKVIKKMKQMLRWRCFLEWSWHSDLLINKLSMCFSRQGEGEGEARKYEEKNIVLIQSHSHTITPTRTILCLKK